MGPGNTNHGVWEGGWVGTTPPPPPSLHHPGYYPSHPPPLVHVRHAGTDCGDTRSGVCQGDPRGRIRTVYRGRAIPPPRTLCTAPHCPCSRLPTRLNLSISQYFSVFLSISGSSALSQLYLSYISVISQLSGISAISQYSQYFSVIPRPRLSEARYCKVPLQHQ